MRQGCSISALTFLGVAGAVVLWWRTDAIDVAGVPAIPMAIVLLTALFVAAVARPPGRRLRFGLKVAVVTTLLVLLGLVLVTVLFAVACDDCIT